MSDQLYTLSSKFNNSIFRIPDYQRGYAWRESQLVDFWEDLINLNKDHYHYTGMLSLKKASKEDVSKWGDDRWIVERGNFTPYYVVDGQQRLTTCVILINEILNLAIENNIEALNDRTLDEIRKQYIVRKSTNNINFSYLFGYEIDNPSFNCLRYEILGEENPPETEQTFYTQNLLFAKEFFAKHLKDAYVKGGIELIEDIFYKLTSKFMFNVHEIDDDFDVFVAFETMNNRGKRLSNLELLKNRLIYLTTLYNEDELGEDEQESLRKEINNAWKEVYHQLGRKKDNPLNDDEFLKAHWSLYFTYSRSTGNDYVNFLLKNKFTPRNIFNETVELTQREEVDETERTDVEDGEIVEIDTNKTQKHLKASEIKNYVKSLNSCAKYWYYTYYPYESPALSRDEKIWIDKLNNIGINYFRPLVMVAISKQETPENRVKLFKAIERFIFLYFRLGMFQASYKSSQYMVKAKELMAGKTTFQTIIDDLNETCDNQEIMQEALSKFQMRMKRNYTNYEGFYSWRDIKYFLYEYEMYEFGNAGINKIDEKNYFAKTEKDKVSIEHIYPQTPIDWYWANKFRDYTEEERTFLTQSLGNLLPLSQSINSSLQNYDFNVKKKRYEENSYSALEVSKNEDWTPIEIYNRGIKLMNFMKERWQLDLTPEYIEETLQLSFVKDEERVVTPELEYFERVEKTKKEIKESERKKGRGNEPISLEEYLSDKNENFVNIFNVIYNRIMEKYPDTEIYALPQYVGFKKGKYYFAEIKIRTKDVRIMTLLPEKEYPFGHAVPENFLWALRYKMMIDNLENIDDIMDIISNSYEKR